LKEYFWILILKIGNCCRNSNNDMENQVLDQQINQLPTKAKAEDFIKATQRVYHSKEQASSLEVQVIK
jgi:hypothetical protein